MRFLEREVGVCISENVYGDGGGRCARTRVKHALLDAQEAKAGAAGGSLAGGGGVGGAGGDDGDGRGGPSRGGADADDMLEVGEEAEEEEEEAAVAETAVVAPARSRSLRAAAPVFVPAGAASAAASSPLTLPCPVCGDSSDGPGPDTFLLCDGCETGGGHLHCLELGRVPRGSWFCNDCEVDGTAAAAAAAARASRGGAAAPRGAAAAGGRGGGPGRGGGAGRGRGRGRGGVARGRGGAARGSGWGGGGDDGGDDDGDDEGGVPPAPAAPPSLGGQPVYPDLSVGSRTKMEAFFSLANLGAMEADPVMNLFATASRSVIVHRLMLWCLVNPLVLFVFGGAVMESFVNFEDKDREVKDIDVACSNRVDMLQLASDLQNIVGAIPGMQSTYELIEPDDNDRRTWWKNRHVKLAFTHKAVTVELDICDAEHVRKRPDTDTGKLSNLVQNFGCERCWRRVRGLRWGGGLRIMSA